MPLYQVEYTSPLTRSEKNDLAASITQIHQSAYGAPSIFIGVTFKDISAVEYYAGSKLKSSYNRIFAIVRTGGSRTVADFNKLALALSEAWDDIVVKNDVTIGRAERNLSGVFVLRSIEWSMVCFYLKPGQTRHGLSRALESLKREQKLVILTSRTF
ncbi:hypothetical protein V8E54_010415 [Elaphomyces granulatus]